MILSDSVVPLWLSLSASVASICDKYVAVVDAFRLLATYLEINVAGFRKILKQINKQLPGYVLNILFKLDVHRFLDKCEHDYAELASLVVPHKARIDAFRDHLQSVTSEFSSSSTPLPVAELGTETILALSGNYRERKTVIETKSEEDHLASRINSTSIHL